MLLLLLAGCPMYDKERLEWVYTQLEDDDGDGFREIDGDCDDTNPDAHPGQYEVCNGFDDDCNGDADGDALDIQVWYQDRDGDGYGSDVLTRQSCTEVPTFANKGGDCDEEDATIHPEAETTCGEDIDRDCDGVRESVDQDRDGSPWCADCNDFDPSISPLVIERCNEQDDDCDGQIDEAGATLALWYPDVDGDGYGDEDAGVEACDRPASYYVLRGGDCEDLEEDVNPDAAEVCENGVDDNCDGDADGCGLFGTLAASTSLAGTVDFPISSISGLPGSGFSSNILNIGDYDGDGIDELVVGYSDWYAGKGGMMLRPPPSIMSEPVDLGCRAQIKGEFDGLGLGHATFDPSMDLTGDGVNDLLIGMPFYPIVHISSKDGGVDIMDSTIAGVAERQPWIEVYERNGYFGYALGAADLSGDGYTDLIAGGPGVTVEAPSDGIIYGFDTPVTHSLGPSDALWTISGATSESAVLVGHDFITMDWNADGYPDIAAGTYENAQTQAISKFYIMEGPAAGDFVVADLIDTTIQGLSSPFDANGDGHDEVWVTEVASSNWYLVTLPMAAGSPSNQAVATLVPTTSNSPLAAQSADDYDGDGYQDSVFFSYGELGLSKSASQIYFGPFNGAIDSSAFGGSFEAVSENNASYPGPSGDYNGDGLLDLSMVEPASSSYGEIRFSYGYGL